MLKAMSIAPAITITRTTILIVLLIINRPQSGGIGLTAICSRYFENFNTRFLFCTAQKYLALSILEVSFFILSKNKNMLKYEKLKLKAVFLWLTKD